MVREGNASLEPPGPSASPFVTALGQLYCAPIRQRHVFARRIGRNGVDM